ncbi:MAG: hypothetical protein HC904_15490 [Blastochloris sp.]|nr:hypothetical protein [Blastochloris sp.]
MRARGQLGQTYVTKELSWDRIARQMLLFYQWLLQPGACPDFIRTD